MKLIEEWRSAWKWFSVQSMALATAALVTWGLIPEDLKTALPSWLVPIFAAGLLILGIAGRLVQQNPKGE